MVEPGEEPRAAATGGHSWSWEARRLFICADGDADKAWGNETTRWHPAEASLEIELPAPLSHLANRPHGRYRLSCEVTFPHRGDELAAQVVDGAARYDISFDPNRHRGYLDASWRPRTPRAWTSCARRRCWRWTSTRSIWRPGS